MQLYTKEETIGQINQLGQSGDPFFLSLIICRMLLT